MRARLLRPVLGSVLATAAGSCVLGCGSHTPTTLRDQVAAWARTTGFADSLSRVRGDLSRAAGAPHGAPLRTACDVLVTDSLAANQQLPTPDASLTAALTRAYASAASSGHDCFEGAGGDDALLARATSARQRAARQLVVAEARYDSVTSSLPAGAS